MAITKFVPEVWSRALLIALRNRLILAGLCNRDYEGEIAEAGDTVHIVSFALPAVRSYSKNTDISWDLLTDDELVMTVAQSDYFAFTVDDIDRRQALPGFVQTAAQGAAYNLAAETDSYISGVMEAGVAAGNKLGTKAVNSADSAYGLLVSLRAKLAKANVPDDGRRWVALPTDMYSYLQKDNRFIDAAASSDAGALRTGNVGRALGFDIYEAQTLSEPTSGTYVVLAGHPMATTFAEQIAKTEAIRRENQFADGIKGLHLYDAKVVRPTALVSAHAAIS